MNAFSSTDINMSTLTNPRRTAMDFAAAGKANRLLAIFRESGGYGLCERGQRGGFVQRR